MIRQREIGQKPEELDGEDVNIPESAWSICMVAA